jgi:hypothetical protein
MSRIPLTTTIEEVITEEPVAVKDVTTTGTDNVEVPYMDYEQTHSHPYSVDYFKLGDTWEDPAGGFPKEINLIETYIKGKIDSGEIANSVTAIRDLIKHMEKFNNLNKEERSVVKIEVLSNYVEFMMKNDKVKSNLRRYNYGQS